jgi:CRP/FNR family transcriptional regulator, polysaccharide utilization system transcription regulator
MDSASRKVGPARSPAPARPETSTGPFGPRCSSCPARASSPLACLTQESLERLDAMRTEHVYEPRQPIYYEGTPALVVYCVRAGRVKLLQPGSDGDLHVIGIRGPGAFLGIRAAVVGKCHTSTAEPIVRTTACAFPMESLAAVVRRDAEFAYGLLHHIAVLSTSVEKQLVDRSLARVRQRVAAFLARCLPGRPGEPADPLALDGSLSRLPREELAQLIGTSPETLSRTLHALAEQGILELRPHEIVVLDAPRLRRIAREDHAPE